MLQKVLADMLQKEPVEMLQKKLAASRQGRRRVHSAEDSQPREGFAQEVRYNF